MLEIREIRIKDIRLGDILPGELVDNTEISLNTFGMIAPLLVSENEDGGYDIIDGRKRAATIKMTQGEETVIDVVVVPRRKAKSQLKLTLNNTKTDDDLASAEIMKELFPKGFADKKAVKERLEELSEETGISKNKFRKWIKVAVMDADLMEGFKRGNIDRSLLSRVATLSDKYFKGTTADYEEKIFIELKKMSKDGEVVGKDGVKKLEDKFKPLELIQEELKKKLKNSIEKCLENDMDKDEIVHIVKE